MRLLILGGTVFLGRHLVEAAVGRGHHVTLFNRGRSAPDLFPEVERVVGDRDGGLAPLRGQRWDAVVDTSGFVPRVVRQSVEMLRDSVDLYVFISTGSVYPLDSLDLSEDGPVSRLDDPAGEDVQANYGGLKALNVRSGLIAGAHDPTGRFTYWPLRLARGGEVLAPGGPEREVQFIDVRDEADWILDMAARDRGGTFNVTGPAARLTLRDLLARCGEASLTWVDDDFLTDRGVRPYSEMPLWVPPSAGSINMPIDRALAAGLCHRDLEVTISDVRAWAESLDEAPPATDAGGRLRVPVTLTPGREAELLRDWHELHG